MKNVILAFSAMLAFATTSLAQAPAAAPTPASKTKGQGHAKGQNKEANAHGKETSEKAKGKMDGKGQFAKELGLTPEQETSFMALNNAQKEAMKAVQMDKTLAADAKKAKVEELKNKYEADVKGVLNADQYTKWMEKRAKRDDKKEEMGDHKGKGKGKGKMNEKAAKGGVKSDKTPQPQSN